MNVRLKRLQEKVRTLPCGSVLRLNEREQIRIDLLCVNDGHAMRKTGIDLELRILYQLCGECPCIGERYDLVIITMHNQGGNVDFLQVFREIGLGKSFDAVALPLLQVEIQRMATGLSIVPKKM